MSATIQNGSYQNGELHQSAMSVYEIERNQKAKITLIEKKTRKYKPT